MKNRQPLDTDPIAVKHNSRSRQRDVSPASSYDESSDTSVDSSSGYSDNEETDNATVALCDRECEMMEHAYSVYSEMIANSCAVMMRQLDTLSRLVSLSAPMFDLSLGSGENGIDDADGDGDDEDEDEDENEDDGDDGHNNKNNKNRNRDG